MLTPFTWIERKAIASKNQGDGGDRIWCHNYNFVSVHVTANHVHVIFVGAWFCKGHAWLVTSCMTSLSCSAHGRVVHANPCMSVIRCSVVKFLTLILAVVDNDYACSGAGTFCSRAQSGGIRGLKSLSQVKVKKTDIAVSICSRFCVYHRMQY